VRPSVIVAIQLTNRRFRPFLAPSAYQVADLRRLYIYNTDGSLLFKLLASRSSAI